jgi:hypothetical protein
MNVMRRILCAAGLAAAVLGAGCGGDSGVVVLGSWSGSADMLHLVTTLAGAQPSDQPLQPPFTSPYKVLVHTPAGTAVQLRLEASHSGATFAVGEIGVTPGSNEILQVSLALEPVAAGP